MKVIESFINWINSTAMMSYFPRIGGKDIIEILLLTFLCYYCVKNLRGTRAWLLLKGLAVVLSIYSVAYLLEFTVVVSIFQSLLMFIGVAIIVAIQPEIRKFVENVGTKSLNQSMSNMIRSIFKDRSKEIKTRQRISDATILELVKSCFSMGKVKTGALIALEGDIPLNDFIESGIKINGNITAQLIINIFEHNTPLHDGAVVVQSDKIAAATCYLPLSNSKNINKELGTRHRAAIGLSESTDALVIIVSEETGFVSVAIGGKIHHNIDREKLSELLSAFQNKYTETTKVKANSILNSHLPVKMFSLLGACMLWFIVVSNTNPMVTNTIRGVEVEVINQEVITDLGKTYSILSGDTVSIDITDHKDVIDQIDPDKIKVVADFSKLSCVNAVQLEAVFPDYPDTKVKLNESTMTISLEDVVTTEVNILTRLTGKTNENYFISGIDLSTDTLIISGAKSLVNTIGDVVIEVDQSKLTNDISVSVEPVIYDKNGEVLDNTKFILSNNQVTADIHLYKTKKIPLNITTTIEDQVLKGIIKSIDYVDKEIYVTGPDELLDKCKSLDISIPLDIDLTDISKNQFIKNISLQSYMPEGLLVTSTYSTENLTIDFDSFYMTSIFVGQGDIEVRKNKGTTKVTVNTDSVVINVIGSSKDIEGVTLDEIKPYIDVSDLGAGSHTVKLKFMGMQDQITGDLEVKVAITNN